MYLWNSCPSTRRRTPATRTLPVGRLLLAGAFGLFAPGLADAQPTTTRVSVGPGGAQADQQSYGPTISADGRWVAFHSFASNLVVGDTNNRSDVFVYDQQTGTTTRVSVGPGGAQGNYNSQESAISADGRWVSFTSAASNLVAGDTNGCWDVFVHDRQTGTTTRVSVGAAGAQADGNSWESAISADGRWVAFYSEASNLVAGDTNDKSDVFVHDRQTGMTTRVSVGPGGAQGSSNSYDPAISADGRWVAFWSHASNLVAGDTNGRSDVFVYDRQTGTTTRASVGAGGAQADGSSWWPAISADGRWVAFPSAASNLVAGDTNGMWDVFVHDLQTATTVRVSIVPGSVQGNGASWYPAISANGRWVAFYSEASNLVASDTNGADDVFVHDRQTGTTTRVSVGSAGAQGNGASWWPAISADGSWVAFHSIASNLVPGDTNGVTDVFVHDRSSRSVTVGGITLTYPDYPVNGPALPSCEPWADSTADQISLTGIPQGSHVTLSFAWSSPHGGYPTFLPQMGFPNVQVDTLQVPVPYPTDTTQWPIWTQATNERAIAIAAVVHVFEPDGSVAKLNAKKWWVRCLR